MPKDHDGNEISEYEALRLERIARNQAKLEQLGLLNITKTPEKKPARKKRKPLKKAMTNRRKSRRLCNKNEDLVMISYQEKDGEERAVKQGNQEESKDKPAVVSPSPVRRRYKTVRRDDWTLSDQEKKILQSSIDQNFLSKFEEFLVFHNKISNQNVRNVMKQVSKLAHGEGIRYESPTYGWAEGCYFRKGTKITPMSDIVALMQEAQECEDKWGRDHGNGWLLSHPLKKLLMFQQFVLTNPDFLTCKSKLKDYYEME